MFRLHARGLIVWRQVAWEQSLRLEFHTPAELQQVWAQFPEAKRILSCRGNAELRVGTYATLATLVEEWCREHPGELYDAWDLLGWSTWYNAWSARAQGEAAARQQVPDPKEASAVPTHQTADGCHDLTPLKQPPPHVAFGALGVDVPYRPLPPVKLPQVVNLPQYQGVLVSLAQWEKTQARLQCMEQKLRQLESPKKRKAPQTASDLGPGTQPATGATAASKGPFVRHEAPKSKEDLGPERPAKKRKADSPRLELLLNAIAVA